jgi:hypothetical protein
LLLDSREAEASEENSGKRHLREAAATYKIPKVPRKKKHGISKHRPKAYSKTAKGTAEIKQILCCGCNALKKCDPRTHLCAHCSIYRRRIHRWFSIVFLQRATQEWNCTVGVERTKRCAALTLTVLIKKWMAKQYSQRLGVLCFRLLSYGFGTHVRIWKKSNAARSARRFLSDFAPMKGKKGGISFVFRIQIAKCKAKIKNMQRVIASFFKVTQVTGNIAKTLHLGRVNDTGISITSAGQAQGTASNVVEIHENQETAFP